MKTVSLTPSKETVIPTLYKIESRMLGKLAPNIAVKALPTVAGTRRKRRAPYLER